MRISSVCAKSRFPVYEKVRYFRFPVACRKHVCLIVLTCLASKTIVGRAISPYTGITPSPKSVCQSNSEKQFPAFRRFTQLGWFRIKIGAIKDGSIARPRSRIGRIFCNSSIYLVLNSSSLRYLLQVSIVASYWSEWTLFHYLASQVRGNSQGLGGKTLKLHYFGFPPFVVTTVDAQLFE